MPIKEPVRTETPLDKTVSATPPQHLTPRTILQLQKTIGNRATIFMRQHAFAFRNVYLETDGSAPVVKSRGGLTPPYITSKLKEGVKGVGQVEPSAVPDALPATVVRKPSISSGRALPPHILLVNGTGRAYPAGNRNRD